MSWAGNPRGPEEMSDQVFAQVLLTLNEVAICFADMPPKVSEDLHHVLDQSSDGETYETELPIEIRSSHQPSGSKMQESGDLGTRCMESEQPGSSEPLTSHNNRHLRDHQEDAGPESAQDKCHTVEHQYCAQTQIDPSNRNNAEHQYCAEPDVQPHTRHHNTEHQYCAEPDNQFSHRHHEMEHHYCADPVVHPSNGHPKCTESENQTSSIHTDLSQKHFADLEGEPIKRHLSVEHQYCAEPANEPKYQEAQHHDCVEAETVPIKQEAEHQCSAGPGNVPVRQEGGDACCSKEDVAHGHQEIEHRSCTGLDHEPENEQANCEIEHQDCGQPEIEPNDRIKLMESQHELQDESAQAYFVREHEEYSEYVAELKNSQVETASQESADPEHKQHIDQIQTDQEDNAEPQGEHPKICLGEGSDNYFEHSNEYVHVQHNQDLVYSTAPNNGIVENAREDYTEPELVSECLIVRCKEEAEADSGSNCIETGERLNIEPEAVHSDRCIAVYHDAYAIVEVGPINGTVGIFHENIKQEFNPSDDYMGSNHEQYAESSYVPINGYCEDPDGETSNQCLVVYHGPYVEQATEPSRQSSEGDPEEYTLQLELLEAASEVTKEHILKLPEEQESCTKTQLELASCSVDGPDMSTECEHGLIQCTNPTVLWSVTSASKAHTCAECGKAFSRNSNLIIHRRTHTGEKPFKCAECAKSFVSSSKLIAHERTHTEPSPKKNDRKDLDACPEKVRANQAPRKDQADSFGCTERGKTLFGKKKTGRKQRSIVCLEHASDVETGVNKSNSRKKPGRKKGVKKIHICIECGRNFSRLSNLVNHQRTHTGEKPYECSECGKRFSDVANMITHGRVHTGEKPFACGRCGKSFSRLSNMKTHQRMHTGEKPYPCSQCDKRFSHSSHLVTHQQLHTGERPHTCEECGKSFSRLANMLTHQKLHKGEKPYLCNVCFKRFNRSSHLTKHLQMHMREDMLMREDALRMEQQMHIREHIIILQ